MKKIKMVLSVVFYLLIVWAFFIEAFYLYVLWGFIGIVIGVFIFPIIMIAMPFYIAFSFGNFSPILLTVIGIVGLALCSIGDY